VKRIEDPQLPPRRAAEKIVARFDGLKILVLGDFMLDQFVWGRVQRISPEAPVPVVDVERETFSPGGAGNVVMNLRAMGAHPFPVGACGDDWAGERLRTLLRGEGISSDSLLNVSRPTTVKTRIVAHQQQVVRVDREDRSAIDSAVEAALKKQFVSLLNETDGVLISDYAKGTITPHLLAAILPAARRKNKLVCLDPKTQNFSSYSPVTVLTPNLNEASHAVGFPIENESDLMEAGRRILESVNCKALLLTMGEKGMALFENQTMTRVPACAREVYDVTGAGDTVISVLTLALAAGASMLDAVKLTNLAAGIVVGKVGTATVTPSELLNSL
jgi:D-glycero-beta-D-manno-heptose-7-phosphate kinase